MPNMQTHEEGYSISFSLVVNLSQTHAMKMFLLLIMRIEMIVNENYYSNKYCCMHNNQIIKLLK